MNRFTVALILGLCLAVLPTSAQLTDVSLDRRTDEATLIVEAIYLNQSQAVHWVSD